MPGLGFSHGHPQIQVSQRGVYQFFQRRFLAAVNPAPPPSSTERSPVLERYWDRLEQKARAEGVEGGADELLQRERLKAAAAKKTPAPRPEQTEEARQSAPAPQTTQSQAAQPTNRGSSTTSHVRPLSSFLDVEKASELPPTELAAVWRLRHASDPLSLCAAVPVSTYTRMLAAARRCPQFVLPLPINNSPVSPEKDGPAAGGDAGPDAGARAGAGAELHFLQWQFEPSSSSPSESTASLPTTTTVLFTRLAEYKVRGEFALPHTTVTHYADLAGAGAASGDSKGLVLMHGQVVADRGISPDEARWLVMCLQRFYGAWDQQADVSAAAEGDVNGEGIVGEAAVRAAERRKLLEWFAAGDERFSVEKLMEEAERMG